MAINYNLSKVHALSDNDEEFVLQVVTLFVTEVPEDLKLIEQGINDKNHHQAYSYAHKIKPSLDLIGMAVAHQEILEVEAWGRREGKRKEIEHTFESVKSKIEKAVKEIKKDFNI